MKIVLTKPISKDGKEFKELNLDFDKITGREIIAAEKETRILGDIAADVNCSKAFQAVLIAKAAAEPVGVDDILSLPGADFIYATSVASNFLFGWVLPGAIAQEKPSEEQP